MVGRSQRHMREIQGYDSGGNSNNSGGPAATAPAAFTAGQWSIADKATGGTATITISTLPSDGGSAITKLQYAIGAAAYVDAPISVAGSFDVGGFTNGAATNVKIRAVNAVGNGPGSDTKSVTTSAPLTPLDPALASQPMAFAFSPSRRIRAAYGTGQVFQVRDSTSQLRTLTFNSDGTLNAPAATWSTYGDGVTFTIANGNDQSPNARHFATSATRPKLIFPNAPTSYDNPYIDYGNTGIILATTAAFMDIGGTANLSVFVVHKRLGFGSATNPLPRPGVASASVISTLVGFGTGSNGQLIVHTPTTGNDPIGGVSECVYNKPTILSLDESAPSASNGWEVTWFNQAGDTIAGGGDNRKHWSGRKHNVASQTGQRLVLGASGAASGQFNGQVAELIVFQSATPMTDDECQRISMWLNAFYNGQNTVWDWRYYIVGSGQSNMAFQFVDSGSGDGTAGSNSINRSFLPTLATLMGKHVGRYKMGVSNRTCVGGTSMLKYANPGDAVPYASSWRDETTHTRGNLGKGMILGSAIVVNGGAGYTVGDVLPLDGGALVPGATGASAKVATVGGGGAVLTVNVEALGNYTALPPNGTTTTGGTGTGCTITGTWAGGLFPTLDAIEEVRNSKFAILHAQCEENAHTINPANYAHKQTWDSESYLHLDDIRNNYGQPDAPIVIQPCARYSSDVVNVNDMVRLQRYSMSTRYKVWVAADTGHLAQGNSTNFSAHLGPMINYDATTGGAEDGYQRAGRQNAKAMAFAFGVTSVKWRGPEASAAVRSGANTIDVTISYPDGCAGTDFSTPSGQYGGWRVNDGSNNLSIASVTKLNATTIRITMTSNLPVGGVTIYYEPNFASGSAVGANVRNQIVDNNATEPMPLATSLPLAA